MKQMLHSQAVLPDVRRAAYYYALIRYSYAAGTSTFGSQPHAMWNNFPLIEAAAVRLQKVIVENKDCVKPHFTVRPAGELLLLRSAVLSGGSVL